MLIWIALLLLGEGAGGDPVGPTPDVGSGFSRRRTAAFARKNADYVNRRA